MTRSSTENDGPVPASAPRSLRRMGVAVLGLVLAGAAYLIAVRGEAIIVDLSTLAGQVFCF